MTRAMKVVVAIALGLPYLAAGFVTWDFLPYADIAEWENGARAGLLVGHLGSFILATVIHDLMPYDWR